MKYLKISIITPSYNQGKYIEKTIQSVLSQNYPKLEYIILDSVSKDNTKEVLKKYQRKCKIIIKKDKGQSDAINKGLKLATGEIIGYLNSDDTLAPKSLFVLNNFFIQNQEVNVVTGRCQFIDEKDNKTGNIISFLKKNIPASLRYKLPFLYLNNFIDQPATFWRRKISKCIGSFDKNLSYAMDYDYFLRIAQKYPFYSLPKNLANYRVHHTQKSQDYKAQFNEVYQISCRYNNNPLIKFFALLSCQFTVLGYSFIKLLKL